jgi:hypothetical protein
MRAREFLIENLLDEGVTLTPSELYKPGRKRVEIFLNKVKNKSPFKLAKDGTPFTVDPQQYNEIRKFLRGNVTGKLMLRNIKPGQPPISSGELLKDAEFGGSGVTKNEKDINQKQLDFDLDDPNNMADLSITGKGKESYQIKPVHVFPKPTKDADNTTKDADNTTKNIGNVFKDTEFSSTQVFDQVIQNPTLKRQEIGRDVIKMAEDIRQGQNPTFVGVKPEYKAAIRDYAGEYLGVLGLIKGIANFPTQPQFLKHLGVKNFDSIYMTFPHKSNEQLKDSVGKFKNKKSGYEIWISSKGNKGAAPSLTNAFKIPEEIRTNSQNALEIGFMNLVNDPTISMASQPFYFFNFLAEKSPASFEKLARIAPISENDIEKTIALMDTKFNQKNIDLLPKKMQKILNVFEESVNNLLMKAKKSKETRTPGMLVHYYLSALIEDAVNNKNALPNFEPVVREILQQNFIQINAYDNKKQLTFNVLWPNREMATGRIILQKGSSSNQLVKKFGFRILPN